MASRDGDLGRGVRPDRIPSLPVIAEHGTSSIGVYLGNPNVHSMSGILYPRVFLKMLGTKSIFSAATVDQMPKHVSSGLMFGHPDLIPVPDIDRTSYLLMLGANPYESNGSLATAPDWPGRLQAIRERGGKVVVVDPRRTRTADAADEHVFIRPGADALFLGTGECPLRGRSGRSGPPDGPRRRCRRVGGGRRAVLPELVAEATGVDPDRARRLARGWPVPTRPLSTVGSGRTQSSSGRWRHGWSTS